MDIAFGPYHLTINVTLRCGNRAAPQGQVSQGSACPGPACPGPEEEGPWARALRIAADRRHLARLDERLLRDAGVSGDDLARGLTVRRRSRS